MNDDNLNRLVTELERDEGVRRVPYVDTTGHRTIGVGHNLDAKPLPNGWTPPLDDGQIRALLLADLQGVFDDLDRTLPWWRDLNDVRQRVIANMCFNLGLGKLLGFRNTLIAMRQGRYSDAAAGMLGSRWAAQVGSRAHRLAAAMKTGETQ